MVFAEEARDDLEKILEFNFQVDAATALDHIEKIRSAVLMLDVHPEIGRRIRGHSSLRELVISHGRSGYVALYEYSAAESLVRVVAVRHQHEAGYRSA
ncbi:MAG: type II toxin-antitoxin system RelE/ParE family toxin [Betaproteobacteria bacterium]|nr:type II toxin-antitoxin system RelE/ParE family toxin [Betaproteobacteria bacterium]